MRLLAIQLNQPGDAILTTPALRWLMNQGHEVHTLVQPIAAELLQTMDGLAGVHALPRGSFQIARDIRRWREFQNTGFDWALVFSRCSERPALWARLSGAPLRSALLNENFPTLLSPLKMINEWRRYPKWPVHVVEQHLSLAGAPQEAAATLRLEYAPSAEAMSWREGWLKNHQLAPQGYLHFHLTARWPSKCWSVEQARAFLKEAARLPLPLVVTTGPAAFEKDYARRVLADASVAASEIGTLMPHQLGAIIQGAGFFLGMDSMPMHLAAALQTPGLALFGPSNISQWSPWRSRVETLQPADPAKKMAGIDPATVIEKINCLWEPPR